MINWTRSSWTERTQYYLVPGIIVIAVALLMYLMSTGGAFTGLTAFAADFLENQGSQAQLEVPSSSTHQPSADTHEHHSHSSSISNDFVRLDPHTRATLDFTTVPVSKGAFLRTISVPGTVQERPAHSTIIVTTPVSAIVTRIHPLVGQTVTSDEILFELVLTHEDLFKLQASLLQADADIESLDAELTRLTKLVKLGVVAKKLLIEKQFEKQRTLNSIDTLQQSLVLHGLSEDDIGKLKAEKTLTRHISLTAPKNPASGEASRTSLLQVEEIKVSSGQYVAAGEPLAVLSNHATLYVEGEAFESDIAPISQADRNGATVSVSISNDGERSEVEMQLRIMHLAAKVNLESRTLPFFMQITNEVSRDTIIDGRRFITWRFRPGQRLQIQVPVENVPECMLIPRSAIVQQGDRLYVFTRNGDGFDRRSVSIELQNRDTVVVQDDGSVLAGDWVATKHAQRLNSILESKTATFDPHAGHNH